MNKDLLNQLPAGEQSVASTLDFVAEDMQISPAFQWDLESQLMEKYETKSQPVQGWATKIIPALGWAVLALAFVYLLNLTVRSVAPKQLPAEGITSAPDISFEENVRLGNICEGPLALAHNFSVYLTNQDKTGFEMLDENRTIGELRSLTWSPNGEQLAVLGNTTGNGNIYLTDSVEDPLQPILSNSELGYLMDVAWSHNGERLLTWTAQNPTVVYLMNMDGTDLVEIQLDARLFSTPEFAPDDKTIIYYGGRSSTALFESSLDGSQLRMIDPLVENDTGFAYSNDGARLAYFVMGRSSGEARLIVQESNGDGRTILATLPIPKGSGSSVPDVANLNWSADGKTLVFEFGRSVSDRAIYLAYADASGLVKLASSAHAPALSADGKCLAFISNKQVFLLDLTGLSLTSTIETPVFLADLPPGRSIADFRMDKLQWRP